MPESDSQYLRERAATETVLARASISREAAAVHNELAAAYFARIAWGEEGTGHAELAPLEPVSRLLLHASQGPDG